MTSFKKSIVSPVMRWENEYKDHYDSREVLLKEVEKGRMIRLGREEDMQSDTCRARLQALQDQFRKMEVMVANMLQYKAKIDQLKQENSSMKSSYESNLQKYCSHMSTLERDNMMLRNQVKKMEAQLHGKGDDREKSKLLLERLKMVEAENSSLVLENEQQRQQYEKCLDEIANQVVQALLAQKTLREECVKLQSRVQDLELQNKHLNVMFQQRLSSTSDSLLQVQHSSSITSSHVCCAAATANPTIPFSQGEMTHDFLDSAGSLQSMCSEIMGDESLGKPQLSSPPTWLQDKTLMNITREVDNPPNSSTSSTCTANTSTPAEIIQTKIETEFPATNTSPKMKHVSVYERRARSLERGEGGLLSWVRRTGRSNTRSRRGSDSEDKSYFPSHKLKQSTSADAISHCDKGTKMSSNSHLVSDAVQWKNISAEDKLVPETILQSVSNGENLSLPVAGSEINHKTFEAFNRSFEKLLAKNSSQDMSPAAADYRTTSTKTSAQQHQTATKQTLSSSQFPTPYRTQPAPTPALRNPFVDSLKSPKPAGSVASQYYYYDYSDEDSDSRPVSRDFSTASTLSLNELLDSSREGEVTIDDDFFSDWSSMCISPKKRIEHQAGTAVSKSSNEPKLRHTRSNSSSRSRSTSSSPEASSITTKMSTRDLSKQQVKVASGISTAQGTESVSNNPKKAVKQNASHTAVHPFKNTSEKCPMTTEFVSQKAKQNHTGRSSLVKPKPTHTTSRLHTEDSDRIVSYNLSPSPNLSQKSQDLGYASKGSYSQSSPSPSMSHKGTSPWLHSANEAHTFTNKEAMGANPKSVSNEASSIESPKLTRPGQLILAPQDKNFNFQGFSSASSTSSEDKSPLKIFECKDNLDMKSSVIEVKKDGTFVHSMRSIGDSSRETSSSLSASPSSPKIPPPVAKKPIIAVKPEARIPQKDDKDKSSIESPKKLTNITVGFLLHNQSFPQPVGREAVEDIIKQSITDPRIKMSCNQPQELSNPFQTKCQSSDSSFENLRVERSGSKDDGYSTMSSDIHPEILEKFSDTLTNKLSTIESDPPNCIAKGPTLENSTTPHKETWRNSDPALHSRDRSFDLTSDQDSALETSVHSTADMVTSSSSQMSTSSSDHPLSPCSNKVSKIAKLFDGENTKVSLGGSCVTQGRRKSNSASSHASSNSSSPGSPNAFVPSCYQQLESPRRLTNEFPKLNVTKSPGSPVTLKKDSPDSPKSLGKSFAFSKLPSKQQSTVNHQTRGTPVLSNKKSSPSIESKPQSPTKTEVSKSSLPSATKRLPKGFYNAVQQGGKTGNKSSKTSISVPEKISSNTCVVESTSFQMGRPVKPCTEARGSSGKVFTDISSAPVKTDVSKKLQSPTKVASLEGDKTLKTGKKELSEDKTISSICCPPDIYARSSSNTQILTQASDQKDQSEKQRDCLNPVSRPDSVRHRESRHECVPSKPHILTCKSSSNSSSGGAGGKTFLCSSKAVANRVCDSVVNSCQVPSNKVPLSTADCQPSSFVPAPERAVLSNTPVSSSHHEHFKVSPTASTTKTSAQPAKSTKPQARILLTNQGFQQMSSDSDNNDEEDSTSPSLMFDENFLEDIPEENDTGDGYIATGLRNANISSTLSASTRCTTTTMSITNMKQEHCSLSSLETNNFPESANVLQGVPTLQSSSTERQHHFHSYGSQSGLNFQHFPQPMKPISSNSASRKTLQCLARSRSEHNLSIKPKSTSAYDDFFRMAWDSGKLLERSKSVSELDLLPQRSRLCNEQVSPAYYQQAEDNSCAQHSSQHLKGIPPLPPSASFFSNNSNHYFFCQMHHQQQWPQLYYCHSPWTQLLCLDLSDVTELDEEGSELTSTHDSLDMSHMGVISDESPRLEVDEQKRFNSQFYSLCKVDSNRSLLSSGNESRERLSLTSLHELTNNKSFERDAENESAIKEMTGPETNTDEEIAIPEFDDIARQIASLSKTVDELNQSLSSLSSAEFEPSAQKPLAAAPETNAAKFNATDNYHWVDDEFILTSCNGEVIIGGSGLIEEDTYTDIFSNNNSFDMNSTEDATSEFYQVPLHDQHNPFTYHNSAGQDEIFAGSFFDTVKEKVSLKQKKNLNALQRSGSEGNLIEKITIMEKRLSLPVFQEDGEIQREGGRRGEGGYRGKFINSRWLMSGQGDDQRDIMTGSNNDSDDSLASDIGLDHMICQRLFGRKGRFQSSSNNTRPVMDFRKFFLRYGDSEKQAMAAFDFLDNFSFSESLTQGIFPEKLSWSGQEMESTSDQFMTIDTNKDELKSHMEDFPLKETRDVGVDAMSQSQVSMKTSIEAFDQSLASLDITVISTKTDQATTTYGLSETSSSQSLDLDDKHGYRKDSTKQPTNSIDLSVSPHVEIKSQSGCDLPELNAKSQSLKERMTSSESNPLNSMTSYSDFVTDLKQSSIAADTVPPKLPPRCPIITNGSLHAGLDWDILPLPPPPPCLNNEHFQQHHRGLTPLHTHYQNSHHHGNVHQPHAPYVNQVIPSYSFQNSKAGFNLKPLKNQYESAQPIFDSGIVPPPLPPRQPQISHTLDGRPQVLIQPQRIHKNVKSADGRPHSFNHYLIDKSKAALTSPSHLPTHSTYPRPRNHSETAGLYNQKTSSLEKAKDETQLSRIPRRKLKTRRERSKRKQNADRPNVDGPIKVVDANEASGHKQWRDIDVANGLPLSGSSCEDNSSS